MAIGEIHVGDVGTFLSLTIKDQAGNPVDVSAASVKQFIFEKPDVSLLTVSGVFVTDGTDGQLRYAFQAGDLDQAGQWRYQVHIVIGGNVNYSDVGKFKVSANLPL